MLVVIVPVKLPLLAKHILRRAIGPELFWTIQVVKMMVALVENDISNANQNVAFSQDLHVLLSNHWVILHAVHQHIQ